MGAANWQLILAPKPILIHNSNLNEIIYGKKSNTSNGQRRYCR
jgi:hypothetical protein